MVRKFSRASGLLAMSATKMTPLRWMSRAIEGPTHCGNQMMSITFAGEKMNQV